MRIKMLLFEHSQKFFQNQFVKKDNHFIFLENFILVNQKKLLK